VARILLESSQDDVERVRLLSAFDRNSGAWLQALLISSVGLKLNDSTLHIATGLHLVNAICSSHSYQLCEADVSLLGNHGLSCKKSEGRH